MTSGRPTLGLRRLFWACLAIVGVLGLTAAAAGVDHPRFLLPSSAVGSGGARADGACTGNLEAHVVIPPELRAYVTGGGTTIRVGEDCAPVAESYVRMDAPGPGAARPSA